MRRAFFYARRTMALLLVLVVLAFVASLVYAIIEEPLGGSVLVLLLALLGGFLFLLWLVFRILGGIVRLIAGPRRKARGGLGAEYEDIVRSQDRRGGLRRH